MAARVLTGPLVLRFGLGAQVCAFALAAEEAREHYVLAVDAPSRRAEAKRRVEIGGDDAEACAQLLHVPVVATEQPQRGDAVRSEGAIVEVGSFLGLSTNIIAYAAHKYGRPNPFFTCDPWAFAGADKPKSGYFSTGTKEYRDWVMTLFRMNVRLFSPSFAPHTIEAFSGDFFKKWEAREEITDVLGREGRLGGPIAFAYLDGTLGNAP